MKHTIDNRNLREGGRLYSVEMLIPNDFDIIATKAVSKVLCEKLTEKELKELIRIIETKEN